MVKKIALIFIVIMLAFTACASTENAQDSMMNEGYQGDYDEAGNDSGSRSDGESFGLKVIKTGDVSLEVLSIEDSLSLVKDTIQTFNAEISYIHQYSGDTRNYASLTIRVPSEKYEELKEKLESFGEVKRSTTNTTDVTEEYIDLEARLKVLEDKRDAYTQLLNRAETVEEILQVERELERVVYEIESTIGRMRYIDNQVSLSTISLNLEEKAATEFQGVNLLDRIKFALRDGLNSMLNFSVNLVVVIVWLIPFAPFIVLMYFLIKKLRAFLRKRKEQKKNK